MVVAALLLVAPGATRAQAPPPPPSGGALDRLASGLAARLGPALEGRRVPEVSLALQVRLPDGVFSTGLAQLAAVTGKLLATRLGALGFRRLAVIPPHRTPAAARAEAAGAGSLALLVTVVEAGGRVHLRGELWDTRPTLWGRLKGHRPRLLTHLHAAVKVGPELDAYLAAPTAARALSCQGRWQPLGAQPFWGVALGDVDGDGRPELVLLRADAVLVWRWSVVFGRFEALHEIPLPGPRAATAPRFPLAALTVADVDGDQRADILARHSDLAAATVIAFQQGKLVPRRALDGYPLAVHHVGRRAHVALALPQTGRAELSGHTVSWWPPGPARPTLPAVLLGLRSAALPAARGGAADTLLGALDRQGELTLTRVSTGARVDRVGPVGVAFALGDLTGDGQPELVTTAARPHATTDELVVRAVGQAAPLCRVAGFEGSVQAVAIGDVNLDGHADVVAVVWHPGKQQSFLLVVR
jgi:hypothetical protein